MILLNEDTKCLVQGITGKQGSFHTEQMLKYNTNIVAGLTPPSYLYRQDLQRMLHLKR